MHPEKKQYLQFITCKLKQQKSKKRKKYSNNVHVSLIFMSLVIVYFALILSIGDSICTLRVCLLFKFGNENEESFPMCVFIFKFWINEWELKWWDPLILRIRNNNLICIVIQCSKNNNKNNNNWGFFSNCNGLFDSNKHINENTLHFNSYSFDSSKKIILIHIPYFNSSPFQYHEINVSIAKVKTKVSVIF